MHRRAVVGDRRAHGPRRTVDLAAQREEKAATWLGLALGLGLGLGLASGLGLDFGLGSELGSGSELG